MRYIWHHIAEIIGRYKGETPLAHFLKNYFRQHAKLGSRDRKVLTAMAYSWYRCAKSLSDHPSVSANFEALITACLLLSDNGEVLKTLTKDVSGMAAALPHPDLQSLFPFQEMISEGIGRNEWLQSMLAQPRLFIRVRNSRDEILSILARNNISAQLISDTCLSLPNGTKVDQLLPPSSYVVQDASSQQTGSFFLPQKNEKWYDCCSGAGGKSIQLKDLEPSVKLTVSDKRKSILHNLAGRFSLYGLQLPTAHIADVADKLQLESILGAAQFDNIICDVPCSGSGTWARTPEQLYFFDTASLERFSPLQETIAVNVSRHLKKGGRLIYITCSIFRAENEDVVERVIREAGLVLTEARLINGISIGADSMFVAVLKKS